MIKNTKIICTIGPASSDEEVLEQMAINGMDACRLNFSHGDLEEKDKTIENIKKISKKLSKPIAIIADLQGPKLRLGDFEGVVEITKGDELELSTNAHYGQIPLQIDLSKYMKKGERIYINDGLIGMIVDQVKDGVIFAKTENSGTLMAGKGINIPDTKIDVEIFTKKDLKDTEFALERNVDYIAVSYVCRKDDINNIKDIINKYGSKTKVIAKIEKQEAIDNLEEIIDASDAVIVARGDLAVETSPAHVPILQQKIINLARQMQTPVVVATHMLESMTLNPRPSRAEASDVANAVLTQVDAVMLSAETAIGKFPVEAVTTMKEIIMHVELNIEYKRHIRVDWEKVGDDKLFFNAIATSAASLAYKLKSKIVAVATASGRTAILLSAFRPDSFIAGITHDIKTANQLSIVWGIYPVVISATKSSDDFWHKIAATLEELGIAKSGDNVVMVGGSKLVGVSGATDTVKVIKI